MVRLLLTRISQTASRRDFFGPLQAVTGRNDSASGFSSQQVGQQSAQAKSLGSRRPGGRRTALARANENAANAKGG
jgi:hypothetical protein